MAQKAKALENVSKHLTNDEIAARKKAEADLLPDRLAVSLKMPGHVKSSAPAKKYWNSILERMEGVALLDDLDTEVLGVYCAMLARRDKLQKAANNKELAEKDRTAAVNALLPLEKSILSYADKLGLTPAGRVALARKRAAQVEKQPEDDLFGD